MQPVQCQCKDDDDHHLPQLKTLTQPLQKSVNSRKITALKHGNLDIADLIVPYPVAPRTHGGG
jgi:hypothetical protein